MSELSATEALERLRAGNRRYISDKHGPGMDTAQSRRRTLAQGQEPFAVILGCSDSRVPVELVFDQGLGDLFVIRVAGNVVSPTLVGSIEFGAELLGTRLVVVLGHSGCGAVAAALEAAEGQSGPVSPNLGAIVDEVRRSVDPLLQEQTMQHDRQALTRRAVRDNVSNSVKRLRHESPTLENLIQDGSLLIVGAEYSLETGEVDFFDVPDPRD